MPPLPSVSKVIRFDLLYTVQSDLNAQDRFFLQYSGTLSVTDLTTICNTVSTSFNTNMVSSLPTTNTLNFVRATDLSSASSAQVIITAARVGTGGGTPAPGVSMIIRFKIARRYRGGHPRHYFPGPAASLIGANGQWPAATVSSVQTAWSNFMAANIASPPAAVGILNHVNVSYFTGFTVVTNPVTRRARNVPTPRASPLVDAVSSYTVNPKPGSQRRRNLQSP